MSDTVTDAQVLPNADDTPAPAPAPKPKGRWKKKVEQCRRKRETLNKTWVINTAYRKNKVYTASTVSEDATDRVAVPVDWARTKNKASQLFFQVPEVKLRARHPSFEGAAALAGAALNFELDKEMKVHIAMDEVLQDVINAAGIGVAMVGFDGSFEDVQVPAIDPAQYAPEQVQALVAMNGGEMPMRTEKRLVYQCYYARRISPAQFLWPADFVGSDFQKAEWLGYDGQVPLAEALRRKWVDEDYEAEMGDKLETVNDDLDNDNDSTPVGKYVKYAEIFYRKTDVDPSEKDPRKFGRIVLVDGKDHPVIDEDFTWQRYSPETKQWIGMTKYPIKVLTITTMSDEAIPPSDSEIGRPQVQELNKSRTQMILQRERSAPMRWFDVNMVDEIVAEQIEKGTFQGIIPMNGPGDRAVGEVARANYPRETFQFQDIIERDLNEAWSMGPNQVGYQTQGDTSAAEANIMATAASVRLDYERVKVLRFFVELAEGAFDLMQLFQDDEKFIALEGPQGQQVLEAWDRSKIRGEFAFEVKPDAAVKVDVGQKRVESLNLYKLLRRDPLVNGGEVLKSVLTAHGFDLSKAMVPPAPPTPKPINARFTMKGEDTTNPLLVAMMQNSSDKPVTPKDIDAAKEIMRLASIPFMPPEVLPVPQPNQHGQLPTIDQVASGQAKHPGPPAEVDPLNQRYSQGNPGEGEESSGE